MAFIDLTSELTGTLPGLSVFLAQRYVKQAFEEICRKRNWSFLQADAAIVAPAVVTTGTVSVTQYTATVTLNAAASAAVLAQTLTGATPGLTNMQFRVASVTSPAASQVYSIIAADTTTPAAIVLTLDRPLVEGTNAAATYQIYRAYITPPDPNFLGWQTVVDMTNARPLILNASSAKFDLLDPQRLSQGLAFYLGQYRGTMTTSAVTGAVAPNPNVDAGTNLYELWPVPTQGQTFYARYRLRRYPYGDAPTDELPAVVPEGLVMARALGWYAYPWAGTNAANFPTLRGMNFATLISSSRATFQEIYTSTARQDDEIAMQSVLKIGHGLRVTRPFGRGGDLPLVADSNYLQSHLVRF